MLSGALIHLPQNGVDLALLFGREHTPPLRGEQAAEDDKRDVEKVLMIGISDEERVVLLRGAHQVKVKVS